jgi:hypothetical protein
MFDGFNREVRNSMRLLGLRLRYGVAVCEIVVQQYGAAVAANIDLLLTPRGTGVLRTNANQRWFSGRQQLTVTNDGADPVITNDGAGAIHLFLRRSTADFVQLNGSSRA